MTATGTIYGLIDPRDGNLKYIGQTKQRPSVRVRGKYAPRVLAWMAELRAAGLAPSIVHVREGVAAADLLAAEREEITRILVGGGELLNELSTADARELIRRRDEAERIAAKQDAWRELADLALHMLGGPLLPGDLPEIEIPEVSWAFMSKVTPGHREHMDSLVSSDYALWCSLSREQEEAERQLWRPGTWGRACRAGGSGFADHMKLNVSVIAGTPCASRRDASRYLALIPWCMVAVHPWRHLAELGGLAPDDGTFIRWTGRHAQVREALEFLAGYREHALKRIPHTWYEPYEKGPGHTLAAVTAAYSSTVPEAVRSDVVRVLGKMADDHELTRPMADLLVQLDPRALDSVFGSDVAAEIDRELGLAAGTSGHVLRALGKHVGQINDPRIRRTIDRSAQALPVVALPDYRDWSGPVALAAQVISASLVRGGLAVPDRVTAEDYLAEVRALWAPRLDAQQQAA